MTGTDSFDAYFDVGVTPDVQVVGIIIHNPTVSGALDPVQIDASTLEDPADLKALIKGVEPSREIGNSADFRPFAKRDDAHILEHFRA